jgi:hypothetical protein
MNVLKNIAAGVGWLAVQGRKQAIVYGGASFYPLFSEEEEATGRRKEAIEEWRAVFADDSSIRLAHTNILGWLVVVDWLQRHKHNSRRQHPATTFPQPAPPKTTKPNRILPLSLSL